MISQHINDQNQAVKGKEQYKLNILLYRFSQNLKVELLIAIITIKDKEDLIFLDHKIKK